MKIDVCFILNNNILYIIYELPSMDQGMILHLKVFNGNCLLIIIYTALPKYITFCHS